jgi:hypothetical protein
MSAPTLPERLDGLRTRWPAWSPCSTPGRRRLWAEIEKLRAEVAELKKEKAVHG